MNAFNGTDASFGVCSDFPPVDGVLDGLNPWAVFDVGVFGAGLSDADAILVPAVGTSPGRLVACSRRAWIDFWTSLGPDVAAAPIAAGLPESFPSGCSVDLEASSPKVLKINSFDCPTVVVSVAHMAIARGFGHNTRASNCAGKGSRSLTAIAITSLLMRMLPFRVSPPSRGIVHGLLLTQFAQTREADTKDSQDPAMTVIFW